MYDETIAGAEEVKHPTHVGVQLSEMDDALERLQKNVEVLASMLGSVLRDEGEAPNMEKQLATIDDRIVPLADRFRDHVRGVQRISDSVHDLKRRLEL
jgi:archaellum component FlaC